MNPSTLEVYTIETQINPLQRRYWY